MELLRGMNGISGTDLRLLIIPAAGGGCAQRELLIT